MHLEGVVAKFDFINPHSFVYIDVVDAAGNTQTWSCEMASRSVLSRNGLTAERFEPGAKITIDGDAARHKATGCQVRTAHFADGTMLRDTTLYAPTYAAEAELPADRQSIVGVWTMKRFLAPRTFGVLTEAGKRASAAFDPIKDDPAINCDPGSPVRFWINVNEPFEIKREADRVVVDHRFMDSRRVVHLDTAAPADAPRGTMGYSTGRFEGNALVVDHGSLRRRRHRAAPRHPAHGEPEAHRAARGECRRRARDHDDDRRPGVFRAAVHDQRTVRPQPLGSRAVQLQAGVPAMTPRSDDGEIAHGR